jgi:hypothetical protein
MKIIIYSVLHLPKQKRMKKMVGALLAVLVILGSCSGKKSSKGGLVDKDDTEDSDKVWFEEHLKDSLRKTVVDLSDETDIAQLLCQQWEHAEDKVFARGMDPEASALAIVYRGFAFFNDGTMLQNPREQMVVGRWSYEDATKTITITPQQGAGEKYKINAIGAEELVLTKLEGGATRQKYTAQAFAHQRNTDDPFYPANNLWRIKPSKPESDVQIKQRVKDCTRFFQLFHADNMVRDSSQISFVNFPSCFKWYSGGIGIKQAKELRADWMDCFYDRAQALKGHAIMEDIIAKKYQWPYSHHWVAMNVSVLGQMYEKL